MGSRLLIALVATWMVLGVATEAAEDKGGPQLWVVRAWQTENGLPQNTVNALLQSRDGFLWVGTSAGLARFDGAQFRRFGLQDGLRSIRISTLAEDAQGAIWTGTTGGGVSRYLDGRITSFGSAEGFPSDADIVSMASDRNGTIWIGSALGLVKWSNGKFESVGEAEGLPKQQIRALALDAEGALWASVLPGGLYRGEGGRFVKVEGGPSTGVYSLLGTRDGGLWAGEGNGQLWQRTDGAWRQFTPADGLPLGSFVGLAEGNDGSIWISAKKDGLWRWSDGQFAQAARPEELS
ncbi:MAG: ligand-binding sensor domain-containing protein, partial [Chthoniobacteraceae bacterium]